MLAIEQKLREAVELLLNPQTGAYRPFLETAHRRAGPDEPPPTLGRAGPGSRLIAAVKEAADVARAARDPAVLDGLAADPRRKPGRPKPFGQAGELIIWRLVLFWEAWMKSPVAMPKQADGSLKPNQGARFVQDAAAAVMGVKGNARPSLGQIGDILRARTAIDT